METVKLFDPYYVKDPTHKNLPAPVIGRTRGGRYDGYSQLAAMTDDDFPINARYWSNGIERLMVKLHVHLTAHTCEQVMKVIWPNETMRKFSWRMIWEMLYEVLQLTDAGERDPHRLAAAALAYLARKQAELIPDESDRLQAYLKANWKNIPGVEY